MRIDIVAVFKASVKAYLPGKKILYATTVGGYDLFQMGSHGAVGLSVGRSVCLSVGLSVGRSVGRSVGQSQSVSRKLSVCRSLVGL